jgi:hypothetical protein
MKSMKKAYMPKKQLSQKKEELKHTYSIVSFFKQRPQCQSEQTRSILVDKQIPENLSARKEERWEYFSPMIKLRNEIEGGTKPLLIDDDVYCSNLAPVEDQIHSEIKERLKQMSTIIFPSYNSGQQTLESDIENLEQIHFEWKFLQPSFSLVNYN